MLSIRMQRTGRKGDAHYRVVVQDSRQSPTSGKFVARLGHYNPHTKEAVIDKEKAETYLKNGAQPSERVVKLFTVQEINLPEWVQKPLKREKTLKNAEKLRKNQPAPEAPAAEATAEAEEAAAETAVPAEAKEETVVKEEAPAETAAEASEAVEAEPAAEVAEEEQPADDKATS